MKTFDKLKERIKMDLEIEAFNFKRNRPGYWQRTSGAWSWVAQREDSGHDLGSQFSASELLKEKNPLVICKDGSIMPDN